MTPPSHAVPSIEIDPNDVANVRLSGEWTLHHAEAIGAALRDIPEQVRRLDASAVSRLDSLGVLQLLRYTTRRELGNDALRFRDDHRALVQIIEDVKDGRPKAKKNYGFVAALERLGRAVHENAREVVALASFLGETLTKLVRTVTQPRRLRLTATVFHMEQVGLDAVPLVMLLSFLVGAVIAFLGSNILADFGASIYVVELVSISFLREFAVLLTAIILAGRTASAFTAQIGSMVSREEVDAIRTLGLDPVEVLVLPRLLALLVALPALTLLAMLAGIVGGALVCALSMDISPTMFVTRFHDLAATRHFWVGMSKAPIFAFLIASIGCLEGFKVSGSAESVGTHTTSSVVQAIFVAILVDALAAIFYMEIDI